MGRGVFIIGTNNEVLPDVTGLVVINCTGETFTTEDSGKTIANNRKLVVDENGGSLQLSYEIKTSSFTVEAGNKGAYHVDCTSGNIDIILQPDANYPVWFVREDNSGNDIFLIPGTGDINGAASYPMPTQYQKNSVLFNGTNFRT